MENSDKYPSVLGLEQLIKPHNGECKNEKNNLSRKLLPCCQSDFMILSLLARRRKTFAPFCNVFVTLKVAVFLGGHKYKIS